MEDRESWTDPGSSRDSDQMGEPGSSDIRGQAEGAVLTLVCFKCGAEYFFTSEAPPAQLSCERCGNTVFRSFHSGSTDEALRDFEDSTVRDLRADDPEGEAYPGDVLDLDRL